MIQKSALESGQLWVPVQRRTRGAIEFRYSARAILGERSLPS
jgi:hypothetical protein